jgi:hypothetical protein
VSTFNRFEPYVTLDLLKYPLPIVVCSAHKLPRRGWSGLSDEKLHRSLERMVRRRKLLLRRAWVAHELLPPASPVDS